ncbi:MAG: right-handed parallel beta-helix repeat-containing protein, partial [Thermoplasmata archaeon]|nr:right-handed parallel beta-helix repeat-containing protein [Thermoplasmata archaeon]
NTIDSNARDGWSAFHSSTIQASENSFSHNGENGIRTQLNTKANVVFSHNTIKNNYAGISCFLSSTPAFISNLVEDNEFLGIYVLDSASPLITDTIIRNSGNYGICVRDLSRPSIYNCTVEGAIEYELWIGNNSHTILINVTLDRDKVFFNDTDSDLSFGWWVDLRVLDEEMKNAVNATVEILDATGEVVFTGITGDQGSIVPIPIVETIINSDGTRSMGPHNFTAKHGDKAGHVLVEVKRNMDVEIRMAVLDTILDSLGDEIPGVPSTSDLFVRFENMEEGVFLRGEVELEITCSLLADQVLFYIEEKGDERLLGEGVLKMDGTRLTCSFTWNTT